MGCSGLVGVGRSGLMGLDEARHGMVGKRNAGRDRKGAVESGAVWVGSKWIRRTG